MKAKVIFWAYLLVGLGNVIGHLLGVTTLTDYTKVALMPLLIAYVYESTRGHVTALSLLLTAGLIFSWFGDLSLMQEGEIYFLMGLSSFLIAHLVYSYTFLKSIQFQFRLNWRFATPALLYGLLMLYLLVPHTGSMATPVIVYALVICATVGIAAHRHGLVSQSSYQLVLIGIVLFAISDSLLAWGKFVGAFEGSRALVMLTYIAAQWFITEGIVVQEKEG